MNNLSELSKEMDNPIMVSKMKDQIFTTIDKYFNVNLSHNDQTLRRIEKFKKIFRVDDIYKNVTDRLEILSIKISNENSAIMEKQQVVLTIIYGLFGSMSVIYTFLQRLFKYSQIDDWLIFGCSFFMAALIGIIIYFITKILKIKRKNR
jgi:fluoride ion exporter CrcB/FEX